MSRLPAVFLIYMCGATVTANALTLSDEEKGWLSSHKELRLGVDDSWPPFEFRDAQGNYRGLAAEYVLLIEKRLGITLKPIAQQSWNEVLNKAKTGDIDLLPGAMSTPERQRYLAFTLPYLDFPIVILAHKGGVQPRNLNDLEGLKVAVVDNYAPHELLRAQHPELHLTPLPNVGSALKALAMPAASCNPPGGPKSTRW